jgi:histone demethylase JARID1
MFVRSTVDDRSSLDALSLHSVIDRYRFLIKPPEVLLLDQIVDQAVAVANTLIPLVDPLNTASPVRDFALLSHWHRKLFILPVAFDAVHAPTKSRIVFEDWLWKRMVDAQQPAKGKTMRQRKPKLILRQSKPAVFACICTVPPVDEAITVECCKCMQGYHASCVRAPAECLRENPENWRCPCCTVRDARRNQQGDVLVRVQNHGESVHDITMRRC